MDNPELQKKDSLDSEQLLDRISLRCMVKNKKEDRGTVCANNTVPDRSRVKADNPDLQNMDCAFGRRATLAREMDSEKLLDERSFRTRHPMDRGLKQILIDLNVNGLSGLLGIQHTQKINKMPDEVF
uniref:Gag-pol polyprotein n=1 Tax=Steinernema glaseri TaxID=37863 RepID=A0A1I7Z5V2_9BILA